MIWLGDDLERIKTETLIKSNFKWGMRHCYLDVQMEDIIKVRLKDLHFLQIHPNVQLKWHKSCKWILHRWQFFVFKKKGKSSRVKSDFIFHWENWPLNLTKLINAQICGSIRSTRNLFYE